MVTTNIYKIISKWWILPEDWDREKLNRYIEECDLLGILDALDIETDWDVYISDIDEDAYYNIAIAFEVNTQYDINAYDSKVFEPLRTNFGIYYSPTIYGKTLEDAIKSVLDNESDVMVVPVVENGQEFVAIWRKNLMVRYRNRISGRVWTVPFDFRRYSSCGKEIEASLFYSGE